MASSFSKNFGLLQRAGRRLHPGLRDQRFADVAFTQVKTVIRANYSNPPSTAPLSSPPW